MQAEYCSLCAGVLPHHPIFDENAVFCCPGCHAVQRILAARDCQSNARENPLFQEALAAGLIANPTLLKELEKKKVEAPQEELRKHYFEVGGLWCPSCAEVITWTLMRHPGVVSCRVDYSSDLAVVEYSPRHLSKSEIEQLVMRLGYQTQALGSNAEEVKGERGLWLRFIVAAFFTLNIMMFSYPLYASYFTLDAVGYAHLFASLSLAGALPVVTFCFWPIGRRCFNGLRVGVLGMEALVTLGVAAAFSLSLYELWRGGIHVYFDSMAVVVTLILLGKIIENRAKFSAKKALHALIRALPRRGRKQFADGAQRYVPIKEIALGDQVVIFSGEKVVVDGRVVSGEGSCDESLMTGEALAVYKKQGDRVIAGALLQSGSLVVEVTAKEGALQTIINVVEGDLSHKSHYTRAVDGLMGWFVPAVVTLAVMVAVACWVWGVVDPGRSVEETACLRAVAILLISCPCAIGIAAPLAEAHLLRSLAREGALVQNRGCLALLGREELVAFDKTGTITEGRFRLVESLNMLPLQRRLLKGLATQSVHPLAVAVARTFSETGETIDAVQEFAGSGLLGQKGATRLLLGSRAFLVSHGVVVPNCPSSERGVVTTIHFAIDATHVAALAFRDRLRSDAAACVAALAPTETLLLSGDGPEAVAAAAAEAGISSWKAGCHPLEKREVLLNLQKEGKRVVMVGDGINDAPALTVADIGISVITATDISMQVSDILLTTEQLSLLPLLIAKAKKGRRIVAQNLFWAFFYNAIGIPLAALGWLSPLFAASAMVISSLIVLVNARRAS